MAAQTTPSHPTTIAVQMKTTVTTVTTAESPLPAPLITTKRLIIRNLHPSDAESMSLHANNPLIARDMPLSFPDPYTLASANTWINMNINIPQIDNWGICERDAPSVIIGGIGLKPGDDVNSHTATVGYWVGEKFWGRGYVTEALEGLTEWCFTERRVDGKALKKLWGVAFHTNGGSMRCFEKCGYAREGVLKDQVEKHGKVMDLHIFGLTKGDWEERKKKLAR